METRPIPNPGAGEVLIRVKASGSAAPSCSPDRWKGYSPDVRFRRVLGIEAGGPVEEAYRKPTAVPTYFFCNRYHQS